MNRASPAIAVLGASGLIGEAVATQLHRDGFFVVPVARRFTSTQKAIFEDCAVESEVVALSSGEIESLLSDLKADIVVNCIGVLQNSGRGHVDEVHRGFVTRLLKALANRTEPTLLVHLSIPGRSDEDQTPFSRTKREAERAIIASGIPFVILRPGFVVAPAAYGGSALVRALSILPVELSECDANRPFAATDVSDIARTVALLAARWRDGERNWNAVWEPMERDPSTVGQVVNAFRRRLGGPSKALRLPSWLMDVAAKAGDLATCLGWAPPVRSTAVHEMRRGVSGDATPWISATGIDPTPLETMLQRLPFAVQEKWFARLYLVKPLVIGVLAIFWCVSGLIALTVAFDAATAILTAHGFPQGLAQAVTIVSSLTDIAIGLAIAFRRTCRAGLLAGIGISIFYMVGAALITPDLWIEPLGALVKTGPAVVLMIVALAMLEQR